MSYIGTNKVGKMYLGSTAIGKAYLGSDLVYDSAGGSTVLPYDAKIEFLQSSGTQYINTGIKPTTNFKCEIKAQYVQNNNGFDTLVGCYDGTNFGVAVGLQSTSGGNKLYIQLGGGSSYVTSSVTSTTALHTFVTQLSNNTLSINVDGTTNTATYSGSLPNMNLFLFARNKSTIGNFSNAKIYYCKIWNGGNLVFDAIPVRVGQVGYMYDRVSRQLIGNAGSGDFALGDDSAGGGSVTPSYTALNYIKFTGSQWILTDYCPNPKTHLVIDMQFEANGNAGVGNGGNQWIGCYNNTVGNFSANFGGGVGQYGQIFYWFENPYVSAMWNGDYGNNVYNRSTFTYLNNKVTFQGINTNTETKTTTQDGYLTIGINNSLTTVFNRHNLKIFSMKIYEDNVLLHEYYPKQRNSDGVNGLHDIVTDTFITSQTETNLIGE